MPTSDVVLTIARQTPNCLRTDFAFFLGQGIVHQRPTGYWKHQPLAGWKQRYIRSPSVGSFGVRFVISMTFAMS